MTQIVQIVITRLQDGRFRFLAFDMNGIVDEAVAENLRPAHEWSDKLYSVKEMSEQQAEVK